MRNPAPSPIVFASDGPPRSRIFDDVYFSREDGLAEARAVFLQGCGLPGRWAGRPRFTVAELGFGTGLNIAALLQLWRVTCPPTARLSIFSVEAHPLPAADAARALGAWPELREIADLLTSRWPERGPGFHRAELPELRAILDVATMDAEEALETWSGQADAWFLDGFAPAKNPAMWTESLMAKIAARSAPGAIAATYTVAGQVRRNLAGAGFEVRRQPGFGSKRERLEARLPSEARASCPPGKIAIVGAGIAGASLARAFDSLGLGVEVFEAERPGAGASGNPAALVMPGLDAGLGAVARLHAAAFARAARLYRPIAGAVLAEGALQLEGQARDASRFAKVAASALFEAGTVRPLTPAEASRRLGERAPAGLEVAQALVIDPRVVLAAWLPAPRVGRIARLERAGAEWRLLGADGREVGRADLVCIAAGADLPSLLTEAPLTPVRGQLSWAMGLQAPAAAWGSYVAPIAGGAMFGSTHDRGDRQADRRSEDDRRNLAELGAKLPALAARAAVRPIEARASVRAATPDSLPLAGTVAPGLWVLGGLGSRGFSFAPLLAEHVAAQALAAPSPLPASSARLVDPGRFAERARRRTPGASPSAAGGR
ncbi:MAG: tRNA (5-methylaminomethyl-2-thiouridine)(34)-methyltransferase MnmD [Caulobacteraceae bacterium]|nr:tRNA (5-methylaminomethyl-2-thiouridine)(34)-methyltransferase MnmD [Caulobacteraceae bacterium]